MVNSAAGLLGPSSPSLGLLSPPYCIGTFSGDINLQINEIFNKFLKQKVEFCLVFQNIINCIVDDFNKSKKQKINSVFCSDVLEKESTYLYKVSVTLPSRAITNLLFVRWVRKGLNIEYNALKYHGTFMNTWTTHQDID